MRALRIWGAALLAAMAAACVPHTAPPVPAPAPPPPRPVPAPAEPPPPPVDWQAAEPSGGDWDYRQDGPVALAVFRSDRLTFILRCEPSRSVTVALIGAQAPALIVRTSYGERRLPATPIHVNEMLASIAADDPLLDQMAFSRGRLLVQAEGAAGLIVPAWPEIARVTEDCRGE
jgi:hypothetical protein